jgi:hypothetical protein
MKLLRVGVAIFFILLLAVSTLAEQTPQNNQKTQNTTSTPPLPQKTGAINDYSATLGNESRKTLQDLMTTLQNDGKTRVTLLFSRLDPFSNPPQFGEALWQAWQLEGERSIFLLFVTEENDWQFYWRTSADLSASFAEPAVKDALAKAQKSVSDRNISEAAIDFITTLKGLYVIVPVAPPPSKTNSSNTTGTQQPSTTTPSPDQIASQQQSSKFLSLPMGFWYVAGGVGVALVLLLLIRAAFLSACPKCGGPLRKRQESMGYSQLQRRGSQRKSRVVYYCPNCRYQR